MSAQLFDIATQKLIEIETNLNPLDPGGGGGNNGGMDQRLNALELRVGSVDERLTRVEIKLDHVAEEVTNVKWYLLGAALTIVVTVIATVIGTGVGIQQMTVQTFQAAGQERATPAPAQTVQPIIIQLPAQQAPASQPEATAK